MTDIYVIDESQEAFSAIREEKANEKEKARRRRENDAKKAKMDKALVEIMNPWIGPLYIKDGIVKNTNVSKKEYKKQGNKKVRHCNCELTSPGAYKKVYDLWWEVY